MSVLGLDVTTFAVVAALMAMCAGGIGRLLWLLDGRPPLDRPSWWPSAAAAGVGTDTVRAAAPRGRLKAIAACSACCGVPLLVFAGVVSAGVALTFNVLAGAVVLAVVLTRAMASGRVRLRRRPRGAPSAANSRR